MISLYIQLYYYCYGKVIMLNLLIHGTDIQRSRISYTYKMDRGITKRGKKNLSQSISFYYLLFLSPYSLIVTISEKAVLLFFFQFIYFLISRPYIRHEFITPEYECVSFFATRDKVYFFLPLNVGLP